MNKKRVISIFTVICFLANIISLNTAFSLHTTSDGILQDKLATASIFDDLKGIEHKDMANIMLALQANLISSGEEVLDVESLKEDLLLSENTIFNPANMHFFFSGDGMKPLSNGYVSVKCKVKNEGQELRTYYVVFSTAKIGEGFSIEVFTESEWKRWEEIQGIIKSFGTLPKRVSQKPEDAKAIDRYIDHEEGIDKIMRYAHENNLALEVSPTLFDIKTELPILLREINVEISTPEDLIPIEDRKIFVINYDLLPDEMEKRLEKTILIDEGGDEFIANCFGHSSNNAIYIFMPDKHYFSAMTGKWAQPLGIVTKTWARVFAKLILVHEIGAICGLPVTVEMNVREDDKSTSGKNNQVARNELDKRWRALNQNKDNEPIAFELLKLTVMDLNKNLIGRDYAAGILLTHVQAFAFDIGDTLAVKTKKDPKAGTPEDSVIAALIKLIKLGKNVSIISGKAIKEISPWIEEKLAPQLTEEERKLFKAYSDRMTKVFAMSEDGKLKEESSIEFPSSIDKDSVLKVAESIAEELNVSLLTDESISEEIKDIVKNNPLKAKAGDEYVQISSAINIDVKGDKTSGHAREIIRSTLENALTEAGLMSEDLMVVLEGKKGAYVRNAQANKPGAIDHWKSSLKITPDNIVYVADQFAGKSIADLAVAETGVYCLNVGADKEENYNNVLNSEKTGPEASLEFMNSIIENVTDSLKARELAERARNAIELDKFRQFKTAIDEMSELDLSSIDEYTEEFFLDILKMSISKYNSDIYYLLNDFQFRKCFTKIGPRLVKEIFNILQEVLKKYEKESVGEYYFDFLLDILEKFPSDAAIAVPYLVNIIKDETTSKIRKEKKSPQVTKILINMHNTPVIDYLKNELKSTDKNHQFEILMVINELLNLQKIEEDFANSLEMILHGIVTNPDNPNYIRILAGLISNKHAHRDTIKSIVGANQTFLEIAKNSNLPINLRFRSLKHIEQDEKFALDNAEHLRLIMYKHCDSKVGVEASIILSNLGPKIAHLTTDFSDTLYQRPETINKKVYPLILNVIKAIGSKALDIKPNIIRVIIMSYDSEEAINAVRSIDPSNDNAKVIEWLFYIFLKRNLVYDQDTDSDIAELDMTNDNTLAHIAARNELLKMKSNTKYNLLKEILEEKISALQKSIDRGAWVDVLVNQMDYIREISTISPDDALTIIQEKRNMIIADDKQGFEKELLRRIDLIISGIVHDKAKNQIMGLDETFPKTEIPEMIALAQEVGIEISRPILEKNYTLITCGDFYKNEDEYKNDILEYGSIFNLEKIKPSKPETTVTRILEMIENKELNPDNVIVQLPKVFSEEKHQSELKRLIDNVPNVRFMIIDTQGLRDEDNRANYRRNIYAMMLLARKIDKDTPADSKLYRLLKFFMNSCLGETKKDLIAGYIEALIHNDIMSIVKTILSYKPVGKYDVPDYDKISATLISV